MEVRALTFDALLHADQWLGMALLHYGDALYLLLFAIVFCEIGILPLFFLPGDPLLFASGALCAGGALDVRVLLPLLAVATLAGSLAGYGFGQSFGRWAAPSQRLWVDDAKLRRAQAFFEARGRWTFVVSPFIAVVRTFAPFVAGASSMQLRTFVPPVAAGAVAWTGSLLLAGYFFGHVPLVHDHIGLFVLAGLALGIAFVVGGAALKALGARSAA